MPGPVPKRGSVRLSAEAYLEGRYLVTIVTAERSMRFGSIDAGSHQLTALGELVHREWLRTGRLRDDVELGAHVVMPNHFHAVVAIHATWIDIQESGLRRPARSLASVVAAFKASVTREAGRAGFELPVWQRGFHERMLRTESAYRAATEYVVGNPCVWDRDPYRGS